MPAGGTSRKLVAKKIKKMTIKSHSIVLTGLPLMFK